MELTKRHLLLVSLAQAGDREAVAELLGLIRPILHSYLVRMVGPEAAEDLTQDALLQIYRKLRWLNEPRAFYAWCLRISTRLAVAHLKRDRRWAKREWNDELVEAALQPVQARPFNPADELDRLAGQLPPKTRAVLLLHYREEMTLGAIASVLALPIGTVKSRLAYGLTLVRSHLKNDGDYHAKS